VLLTCAVLCKPAYSRVCADEPIREFVRTSQFVGLCGRADSWVCADELIRGFVRMGGFVGLCRSVESLDLACLSNYW